MAGHDDFSGLQPDRILEHAWPYGIDLKEEPMPIFHFDIADGVRLEDPVGLD